MVDCFDFADDGGGVADRWRESAGASGGQSGTSLGEAGPTGGQGLFAGSVPAQAVPGVLPLSLQDAIDRGLKQNLGLLAFQFRHQLSGGQRWQQLAAPAAPVCVALR